MDLWTLLVINLFGGFWSAVIVMMLLMYLVFIMGNVSQFTSLSYLILFFMAMVIGYGFILFSIVTVVGVIYLNGVSIPRMINSAST